MTQSWARRDYCNSTVTIRCANRSCRRASENRKTVSRVRPDIVIIITIVIIIILYSFLINGGEKRRSATSKAVCVGNSAAGLVVVPEEDRLLRFPFIFFSCLFSKNKNLYPALAASPSSYTSNKINYCANVPKIDSHAGRQGSRRTCVAHQRRYCLPGYSGESWK